MKVLIVLLIIYSVFTFSFPKGDTQKLDLLGLFQRQPSCNPYTFGNIGDSCDNSANSLKYCKVFLTCQNGKCVRAQIGSPCKRHTDCYLNNEQEQNIRCINERCTKKRFFFILKS
jgi:hypothetical protein